MVAKENAMGVVVLVHKLVGTNLYIMGISAGCKGNFPLQVPDSAIMDYEVSSDEFQGKDFMDPADDHTTSGKRQPM